MARLLKLLKRDARYLALIAGFFILFVALGVKLPEIAPEAAEHGEDFVRQYFGKIKAMIENKTVLEQIIFIFKNNITASFFAIVSGIIPLFPLLFLFINGVIIGLAQHITQLEGLAPAKFYLSLLPHGIFELTAFFIAVFMGLRFNLIPIQLIYHYKKTGQYRGFLKEYFHDLFYYGGLIILLLAIAAVIEMTVSPLILK
jgi:uncharacterized membrane protein SpoIIM required for sporulation